MVGPSPGALATAGDAYTYAPVCTAQSSLPLAASYAYTRPSVLAEHTPVGHRGGRVKRAAAHQPAVGATHPQPPPVALAHRLQVARVVAEIQHAVRQARARLHSARRVIGPNQVAVARVQRVHRAVLRSKEQLAFVEQRRGLAAARQVSRPANVPVGAV